MGVTYSTCSTVVTSITINVPGRSVRLDLSQSLYAAQYLVVIRFALEYLYIHQFERVQTFAFEMSFSGIVHDGTADGHRVHLPLKGLRAKIMIVDSETLHTLTTQY